jgi:IS5 family transposase
MKTTILIDVETLAIKDVRFTTRRSWDGHLGIQIFRRNAENPRSSTADRNYSLSELPKERRSLLIQPAIKHKEHNAPTKAHNARVDDDVYHQRWMSETGFSLLKKDVGEKLRSRTWHGQFRELSTECIVYNLS